MGFNSVFKGLSKQCSRWKSVSEHHKKCVYNCLPDDEPARLERVGDVKNRIKSLTLNVCISLIYVA